MQRRERSEPGERLSSADFQPRALRCQQCDPVMSPVLLPRRLRHVAPRPTLSHDDRRLAHHCVGQVDPERVRMANLHIGLWLWMGVCGDPNAAPIQVEADVIKFLVRQDESGSASSRSSASPVPYWAGMPVYLPPAFFGGGTSTTPMRHGFSSKAPASPRRAASCHRRSPSACHSKRPRPSSL